MRQRGRGREMKERKDNEKKRKRGERREGGRGKERFRKIYIDRQTIERQNEK